MLDAVWCDDPRGGLSPGRSEHHTTPLSGPDAYRARPLTSMQPPVCLIGYHRQNTSPLATLACWPTDSQCAPVRHRVRTRPAPTPAYPPFALLRRACSGIGREYAAGLLGGCLPPLTPVAALCVFRFARPRVLGRWPAECRGRAVAFSLRHLALCYARLFRPLPSLFELLHALDSSCK